MRLDDESRPFSLICVPISVRRLPVSPTGQEIIDLLVFVAIAYPVLYVLAVRPLIRVIEERDRPSEEMRLTGTVLEDAAEGIFSANL